MTRLVTLLFCALLTFSTLGNSLTVQGRLLHHDCGYWNSSTADLKFLYEDRNIPTDSRVELLFGNSERIDSQAQILKWQNITTLPMRKLDGETMWAIPLEDVFVAKRSYPSVPAMQFVLKVTIPGNNTFYVKGSNAPMGYFEISLDFSAFPGDSQGCVTKDRPVQIPFTKLNPQVFY